MYYKYHDLDIYYETYKNGLNNIIFLHGWGTNQNTFIKQVDSLKENNNLYLIDFPGFGLSSEVETDFNLDTYVDLLRSFIVDLNINNPIIIAHSFGGRVLIKYLVNNDIKAAIFISSAGIKHFKLNKLFKITKYKIKKKYYKLTKNYLKYNLLIKNSGSNDYINLTEKMKIVMNKIIKINLKKHLNKIKCKTLLIWGKYDNDTPIKDAFIFKNKIKNSYLYLLNGSHFIHLEKFNEVNELINNFIIDLDE